MAEPPLHGRIAVITGAGSGIGAAAADALSRLGATAIRAMRKPPTDVGAERASPTLVLDVTSEESVTAAVRTVLDTYGRLDILVNSAGIVEDSETFELSTQTWAATIDTNLTGTFRCCRDFGRLMAAGGGGSIVNVSSIAAFVAGHPEQHVAYDVSKAGVTHMTRILGAEWASRGIRVNAVAPGRVDTPLLRTLTSQRPGIVEDWEGQAPTGRLVELQEVADTISFLAGPQSAGMTGQTLIVDGGTTLG
jgi:NAD(P)-dependent dehydrogenase (short-subunit alcohol dehydrogenase family)